MLPLLPPLAIGPVQVLLLVHDESGIAVSPALAYIVRVWPLRVAEDERVVNTDAAPVSMTPEVKVPEEEYGE